MDVKDVLDLVNSTLQLQKGINKRRPIVSDSLEALFSIVNYGILCGVVGVVGIITNIANIATFMRLGFHDTVNVSLTALALSDIANLFCLIVMSVCYNGILCDFLCHLVDFWGIAHIIAGVPRSCFVCMSSCITAMVAFERCLCVLIPLKVKTVFTKRTLISCLVAIVIVISMTYFPVFLTVNVGWDIKPFTNATSWITLVNRPNSFQVQAVSFSIAVFWFIMTYAVVTLCTLIIVWKLSSQRAWRTGRAKASNVQAHSNREDNSEETGDKKGAGLSSKDKRATRTVTLIAITYIICFFPGAVLIVTMNAVPGFNKGMTYRNVYEVCWSFAFNLEGICSCANIIVYLYTSTRFREAFLNFFTTKYRNAVTAM